MVGRRPSIALDDLRSYWGYVETTSLINPFRNKRYDLVVAQEPTVRIGLQALSYARLTRAVMACEVHGEYLRSRDLPIKDFVASRAILLGADFVRAVNRKIAEHLRCIGVRNVYVIPAVYVKLDVFCPTTDPYGRGEVLMTAARLTREKGLDLLLEAIPLLRRDFKDLRVEVAGDGPERPRLIAHAKAMGLEGVVRFSGWLDPSELAEKYNEAAVFVCTSHHEGGPRTIFEAAACLTPSVSTPVGLVPEELRDGESVVLVKKRTPEELCEKIAMLLSDPELRSKIAEGARRVVVEKFEWRTAIQRYAERYLEIHGLIRGGAEV